MAEFEVSSMDELIRAMQDFDLFTDDVQDKLISAGADTLMATIREEAQRSGQDLQRITGKLTKGRVLKKDKNGNRYRVVSISGNNSRGERNGTVAFVLNYGRSEEYGRIEGSYFWTRAVKRTKNSLLPVYEKIINEELTERSLI